MGESLAGGQVVGEAAPPVRGRPGRCPVSAATRAAPSGPRTQWYGAGLPPVRGRKRSSDVEGVELGQAHPGPALPGEADVGHLCGGEHPVVVEETAELSVPFGQPTHHGQQPSVEVTPAPTTTQRPRRCLTALKPCSRTTDAYSATCSTAGCGPAVGRRSSRSGPWPDDPSGLTTPYPLSPPTRRSPRCGPDVAVRPHQRAPIQVGAHDGALRGRPDGAHCGLAGIVGPSHRRRAGGRRARRAGAARPAGERDRGAAGREWTARLAARTASARPATAGGAGRVRG